MSDDHLTVMRQAVRSARLGTLALATSYAALGIATLALPGGEARFIAERRTFTLDWPFFIHLFGACFLVGGVALAGLGRLVLAREERRRTAALRIAPRKKSQQVVAETIASLAAFQTRVTIVGIGLSVLSAVSVVSLRASRVLLIEPKLSWLAGMGFGVVVVTSYVLARERIARFFLGQDRQGPLWWPILVQAIALVSLVVMSALSRNTSIPEAPPPLDSLPDWLYKLLTVRTT